jgi:hypothetical protein
MSEIHPLNTEAYLISTEIRINEEKLSKAVNRKNSKIIISQYTSRINKLEKKLRETTQSYFVKIIHPSSVTAIISSK